MSPKWEQLTMNNSIVSSLDPVSLLGGADIGMGELNISLSLAPTIVAADGGADHAFAHGLDVAAVIGDLDSLSKDCRAAFASRVHGVPDQDSTDFEKVLNGVEAPYYLASGFLGRRLDHTLSTLNVLVRLPAKTVFLLSADDVVFLAPATLDLHLPVGCRIGLLPFGRVKATSTGLRWNVNGLDLHPTQWVSSSNEVASESVSIQSDGPLFITLPLAQTQAALDAVL